MAVVDQCDGPPALAEAVTREILREYRLWVAARLTADCGVVFDDLDTALVAHEVEFTQDLPRVLGAGGRLLVARVDGEVVGVGALKPVDPAVAEIKRMYVRPRARGRGIGRAILQRLLADARSVGYRVVRLETAPFMAEAHTLYRSMGFQDAPMFDNPETGLSGIESLMLFMELRLDQSARV